MIRAAFVLFALLFYAIFFGAFLYLIGFVAGWTALPTTVDRGIAAAPAVSLAIDVLLIALFGVQHSVMARRGFKTAWLRIVPEPIERSVYVLCSSLVLIVLMALWSPIDAVVWHAGFAPLAALLWMLFAIGWLVVLLSTYLISHFELFGLAQVVRNWRGGVVEAPRFRRPLFYNLVRHPLYSGFLLAFWATPLMTAGHLLLAAGMTVYILIAIRYEERDLVALFGTEYEQYRREVGKVIPRFRRTA